MRCTFIYRCTALSAALILTCLIIIAVCGPVNLVDLRSLLGLSVLARLSVTPVFWEFVLKAIELLASIRDVGRRLPLVRSAWSARHWLRWRLLHSLALHGGIALVTVLLLAATVHLLIRAVSTLA